jgi:hypothetical protein
MNTNNETIYILGHSPAEIRRLKAQAEILLRETIITPALCTVPRPRRKVKNSSNPSRPVVRFFPRRPCDALDKVYLLLLP